MNNKILSARLPVHTWELYELLKSMAGQRGYCCPTNIELRRITNYSAGSVQKSINKLCANGYITKELLYGEDGRVCGRKITIIPGGD